MTTNSLYHTATKIHGCVCIYVCMCIMCVLCCVYTHASPHNQAKNSEISHHELNFDVFISVPTALAAILYFYSS